MTIWLTAWSASSATRWQPGRRWTTTPSPAVEHPILRNTQLEEPASRARHERHPARRQRPVAIPRKYRGQPAGRRRLPADPAADRRAHRAVPALDRGGDRYRREGDVYLRRPQWRFP